MVAAIRGLDLIRNFIKYAYEGGKKEERGPLRKLVVEKLVEMSSENFEIQMIEMPPALKWDVMLAMSRHLESLPEEYKYKMKGARRLYVLGEE